MSFRRASSLPAFLALALALMALPAADSAASPAGDGTPPDRSEADCRLDTEKGSVSDWKSMISMQDPTIGNPDAPVTIIEYFDPNCPHCATFHDTMTGVMETHGDDVFLVYKPFPLRASSLPEIEALYAAAQQNKFSEMLKAQFKRQGRGGLSERDIRAAAREAGLKPDVVMDKVEAQSYRSYIIQQRERAIEEGVDSTPTVLVNGQFVQSRSAECMAQFIEEAKRGTLSAAASGR
jgi:protein-disulfide isomerase